MTTMSDPGMAGHHTGFGPTPNAPRALRRSKSDRIISGVAGGLGEYFGVDAVIFRVLFAVLSFFGGVGLLAYALAWLLVPEADVNEAALDKALRQLRLHRVPPWLVIIGGAVLLWLSWFSWWAPGPTFPAFMLLAVVALVLVHRLGGRPSSSPVGGPSPSGSSGPAAGPGPAGLWTPPGWTPPQAAQAPLAAPPMTPGWPTIPPALPPTTPTTTPDQPGSPTVAAAQQPATQPVNLLWQPTEAETGAGANAGADADADAGANAETVAETDAEATTETNASAATDASTATDRIEQLGGFDWHPTTAIPPTTPLIPPLNDTRRSMQAWLSEAGEAHRVRVQRRRPIKVGVGLALVAGWGFVAMLDAFTRVPFPAYIWVGLAILGAGLVASLVSRRLTLSLLVPMALLAVLAVGLGGTRASLRDGSGQIGWMPTAASQLTNHQQFAGQSTLDLTALGTLTSPTTVRITQAAGEVKIRIPAGMNATVISDVHSGDIRNGSSQQTGQHVSGLNVHLELPAPAGATGQLLTIQVSLTIGHVQVDRVS
ncbi:MAG: PspC domain-containing protein [Actinomycetota bacterium]|nr:PspC domain-containing protein [Actinomycetota bacterium]MDQ2955789.1 PspC domain-containing protein [Actinomycetota bacterium]